MARSGDSLPPVPAYAKTEAFLHRPTALEQGVQAAFATAAGEIGIGASKSPFVLPSIGVSDLERDDEVRADLNHSRAPRPSPRGSRPRSRSRCARTRGSSGCSPSASIQRRIDARLGGAKAGAGGVDQRPLFISPTTAPTAAWKRRTATSGATSRRRWLAGLAFLLPKLAGFCAFTLVPLVISFGMAFTDWDFLRHNVFRHNHRLDFLGLENFTRLFRGGSAVLHYLGNTFFLMIGLPFAIAGSLGGRALLLSRTGRRRDAAGLVGVATLVLAASGAVLLWGGMAAHGVWVIFGLPAASVFVAGVLSGGTVYRTLFYRPISRSKTQL